MQKPAERCGESKNLGSHGSRSARRIAVAWIALLTAGCGGRLTPRPEPEAATLPASWTLSNTGATLTVRGNPYRYVLVNGDGAQVLATTPGPVADGYAPVAWTTGNTDWTQIGSPGWLDFAAALDPWQQGWRVVEATETGGDNPTLELVLAPPPPGAATPDDAGVTGNGGARLHVRHILRPSTLRVEAWVEGADDTPRAWSAAFSAPADEGYIGLGERFTRTDHRGLDMYVWAEEGGIGTGEGTAPGLDNPSPNGEPMTYYPVPFLLSTHGYGFWLDSTWRSEFNLVTDRADSWRVWHIGPDLAYEVYTAIPDDTRPWPYHVIDAFTETVGRPMLPPAWAFGPRRRINSGDMFGGVSEIQAMRDLDLAITAVDDSLHFLPAGSHVGREAERLAWTADAEALGYRVLGYYNPYFATNLDSPIRTVVEEGLANDYFLADASGAPSEVFLISGSLLIVLTVDVTNPAASAWYGDLFQWALDLGYSGWMYDFGEYVQPNVVGFNGMTGEELHNLFPVLYMKAAHDALEASPLSGDWVLFARSGFTGASAYVPFVWSGDPAASFESSDGLPSMVRAGLNLGVSGAPHWGGDINGFHCVADGYDAADEELLVRWIEMGALSSNMMDQDACLAANGPGRKANILEDVLAQEAWRTYARLHTRLFPYLYTLAHDATATGVPTMRHLFLEHPDRPELAAVDDAYYFGPALLVAPVVERGATTRTVPLLEERYLDWTDGTLVSGGGTVTLAAPLGKLPLLLRDGYLVPLLDPTIDTLNDTADPTVVGMDDVGDVYDVVALVSTDTAEATFTLWDGGTLKVEWDGGFVPPTLPMAADEAELATCAACWLQEDLGGGHRRVRITTSDGDAVAGGLTVRTAVGRRVRWDIHLVE